MITIKRAIEKRSHVSMYKSDTKDEDFFCSRFISTLDYLKLSFVRLFFPTFKKGIKNNQLCKKYFDIFLFSLKLNPLSILLERLNSDFKKGHYGF